MQIVRAASAEAGRCDEDSALRVNQGSTGGQLCNLLYCCVGEEVAGAGAKAQGAGHSGAI